jgi:gamma-glutamyltranspeptidase/glutathione hydrolase
VSAIDSRETAPAAMGADSFTGLTTFEQQRVSGMSVGVPGTVRGWQVALRRFGTWPLRRVLQPGIRAARRGFVVDQTFFDQTDAAKAIFADFPATAALYLDADGTPRDVGTVLRNPDLARTYHRLARRGANAFYRGKLARAILQTVRRPPLRPGATRAVRPGVMTGDDLAAYRALRRSPTRVTHAGLEIYGMAPPSSGGSTVGEALNILADLERRAGVPLATMPRERALHDYLEASRLAFADRNAYVGDPAFVDVPLRGLLSRSFAAQRAALVGDQALTSPVAPGDPRDHGRPVSPTDQVAAARAGSTTHLTVSDRAGNVVSYTFTIEQTGGNGMVVPGYGFLLNNELTDFNLNPDGSSTPGQANAVEGGKRPRSSIAPTIALRHGRPVLAVGSPGGATIITTVLQILVNRLDFGMSLPDAIAAPRASQRNVTQTQAEPAFLAQQQIVDALQARGHQFSSTPEIGAATAIELRGDGTAQAAAEPVRRGGGSAMVVRADR